MLCLYNNKRLAQRTWWPNSEMAEKDEKEELQEQLVAVGDCPDRSSAPEHTITTEITTTAVKTVTSLFRLGIPIFVTLTAWVAMLLVDAALIGHTETRFFDAVALQSLWTAATSVFLSSSALGLLGAQAYGAGQYPELGIWFQVGLAVMGLVTLCVCATWAVTGPVLELFGGDENLRWPAWYYALVLSCGLPGKALCSQIQSYLQVQEITTPPMIASIVAVTLNLCLGLVIVLGIPFDPNPDPDEKGFGFWACPIITASMEYVQLAITGGYFLWRVDEHWPGFKWKHVWSRAGNGKSRLWTYLKIWFPLALSLASDYWRVSVVGIVAAGLGSDELGVFNACDRVWFLMLTLGGSLASAMSILMGQALGAGQAGNAQFTARIGITVILLICLFFGVLILLIPRQLGAIFSSDKHVLDLFESTRWPMAAVSIGMTAAVAFEQVPAAMGRTRVVLGMGLIGSWVGQVPAVFLCVHFWRNDLVGLFTGMFLGYLLLCGGYVIYIIKSDWAEVAREVLELHAHKEK